MTKLIVEVIPPLWTNALRCWIALTALLIIAQFGDEPLIPDRRDDPIILSISLRHVVGFSALIPAGVLYIPAGKAIVLGYTTPLEVAVAAPVLLGERTTRGNVVGVVCGVIGVGFIFNPQTFDLSDPDLLYGCALVLLASVCWAASILYVRLHRWIARPLQLLPWQVLIAGIVLTVAVTVLEDWPRIEWKSRLIGLLMYAGLVGPALAFWEMSMVNCSLPALTTSIGITATAVSGIASAAVILGGRIHLSLAIAAVFITGGIAFTVLADRNRIA